MQQQIRDCSVRSYHQRLTQISVCVHLFQQWTDQGIPKKIAKYDVKTRNTFFVSLIF